MLSLMSSVPVVYRIVVHAARAASWFFRHGSGKVARGIEGRRKAQTVLGHWVDRERDPDRPIVWIHAPSVGEALQAEAVALALAARVEGIQVVFTHFSPSAEAFVRQLRWDVSTYLPWDIADSVGPVLDAVAPNLLVFTKTEVWPVLVSEAEKRGIPVAIVAASVPREAGRRKWLARALLHSTWSRLSIACAVSDVDAEALLDLGVSKAAVHTTGDPGVDSASRRLHEVEPSVPHLAHFLSNPRPTLVAGSTWPSDERVLLPALCKVRDSVPNLRVIIAPHEPTQTRVNALLRDFGALGWESSTLSEVESKSLPGNPTAVVVDRVGVLAELYKAAAAAYVGGGFGRAGLHSVLEPAAAGVPVVFGPRHRSAHAAVALLAAGAARVGKDSCSLADVLVDWLSDPKLKQDTAGRSIGYIDLHLGAADRTAALLDSLIQPD